MKLDGKRIVITGGTSGIGYELVKQLHGNNELIVIARNGDKLHELGQEFDNIKIYQADLSKLEDVEAVADIIVKKFDSIDILINNAAVQHIPTFMDDDFRYESISYEVTLNFTSICCLCYLLLPALLNSCRSVILNVNSGLSLAPKTTSAVYCGTKGALNIFSQSLRYQLEETNVSVQQVFLELVDTAMTEGRGTKKMLAAEAADKIIHGITCDIADHYIGKVKILRVLLCLAPALAKKLLKKY